MGRLENFVLNPLRKFAVFILGLVVLAGLFAAFSVSPSAMAQVAPAPQSLKAPVTEGQITSIIKQIEGDPKLTPEEKENIKEIYANIQSQLDQAKTSIEWAGKYSLDDKSVNETLSNYQRELASIEAKTKLPQSELLNDYKGLSVEAYQQALDKERTKSQRLLNQIDELEAERSKMDQRPGAIVKELAEIERQIGGLTQQMATSLPKTAGELEKATRKLLEARLYAARLKKIELEKESASLVNRRKLISMEIQLARAKRNLSNALITVLNDLTGAARVVLAQDRLKEANKELAAYSNAHPLVQAYARQNVELAKKNLAIATSEGNIPEVETKIGNQLQQVSLDRNVAEQILSSKKVNKAYGQHLRSLRKKQPKLSALAEDIKTRESDLQDALFQRIRAQEDLGVFNTQPLNLADLKKTFDAKNGPTPELNAHDRELLRRAYASRRTHLNDLASITTLKARKLAEVNSLHQKLYGEVKSLTELLDSRLLWLPSTEPVGLNWPTKVAQGLLQTFSVQNIKVILGAFLSGLKVSYFLVFLLLGLLGSLYLLHSKLREFIATMGSQVGRVQRDRYVLTPIAILDGILEAASISGLFIVAALVLKFSITENEIIRRLESSFVDMTGPVMAILALHSWSRKGALFDVHFNVDQQLRSRLRKNTNWILLTLPLGLLLSGMTKGSFEYDSSLAALGVFGFILGALSISLFALKLAWGRSKYFQSLDGEPESIYLRYERWFLTIAILLPLGTAILAALGYFETASLLLSRLFFSSIVLILAYIIHGFLKRTIEIAQRRMALEQARARRDRMVKERMEKAAAEERGEIAVPKLDTDSIDLETINRQSRQLVNITVFFGAIAGLWGLWSDIVPALSVFDDVVVWHYSAITAEGTKSVPITLWNIMQAIGIALITLFAGRNLPGFLEMFVLKRLKMKQGSRFAIVTVLGYMIFIIGMLVAFDRLGVQWSSLQWIVAALGVGIGFGLQAIFANFISGLIILFERPIRIGDYVTVGDISGTVTRIQIRATTLLDLDNKEILIPNQELISSRVTNWTLANPVTRLIINVGIAYGSDTELAHKIMLETIKANKNVLNNPEPTVLFLGFGESSLDFEARVFLRDFAQRFVVSHELHMAIDAALREANIEISFPQRDLHIRGGEGLEQVIETFGQKRRSQTAKTAKAKPSEKPQKEV